MLVRVQGTSERSGCDYKLNLVLPVLYLDDTNYTISLRSIMMDCHKGAKVLGNGFLDNYWSLKTTAIDRSATNPNQVMATFASDCQYNSSSAVVGDCLIIYEPSIKQEYKLQLTSFHTAEFVLTQFKEDLLDIKAVEILFEFKKYARI